jgi:hypothetical protein
VGRPGLPAVAAKREGGRARFLTIAAVLAAIVVILTLVNLPPSPMVLSGADPSLAARTVRGAVHVHTTRSDGLGDKSSIAAAAEAAGLQFVLLTDHGDGTRPLDPPAYIDGVLCLDAVEISTDDGHYISIGAATAPYPLGGSGASVVEDVGRLGGFGIAAHPTSLRRELQWSDWEAPFDGLEWLNADSEWRDESRVQLSRSFIGYLLRPAGALSRLLDRPSSALARWDALAKERRVLGIAGNDAHGGMGNRVEDGSSRWSVRVPSYRASFGTFSTHVQLDAPLTGDAARDARSVLDGLKAGRFYTEIDAIATGAVLEFKGRTDAEAVEQGTVLRGPGNASFTARAVVPSGAAVVAYRNGASIASGESGNLEFNSSEPGTYRVEVHVPGAPGGPAVPWLVSNPIFRLVPRAERPRPEPSGVETLQPSWRIEKDEGSEGTVATNQNGEAVFIYKLREGPRVSQFVAVGTDLGPLPEFDALTFPIRSAAPRRLSVQLRFARDEHARWGKSVYTDSTGQMVTVRVDRLRRTDGPPTRPPLQRATSLLFVVDLTNARPGDSGTLHIGDVRFVRFAAK